MRRSAAAGRKATRARSRSVTNEQGELSVPPSNERKPGVFGKIGAAWRKKPSTLKRVLAVIGGVVLIVGLLVGIKALMIMRMMAGMKPPPPAVVTTTKVAYQD